MSKLDIRRSIDINAPAEKVFTILNDFHQWRPWSPWLACEPEAKVDVREDGKYYEWTGKRVGSGNMTVTRENAPHSVDYDLTFLKPWKSSSKVQFKTKSLGEGSTQVTWTMDGKLPFFMFFMKKSMTAFISSDYDRGLTMLKEYVEKGSVSSKLNFIGREDFAGFSYIGINRESTKEKMGFDMQTDFGKLKEWADDNQDNISAPPFSIYHKWDMVRGVVKYTAGIPVKSIPDSMQSGMISGSIPATQVYTLQHVGSYQNLGNAWSTLYMMQRGKEFKSVRGIHPFETYLNMPGEVPDEELMTNIHFAVK